MHLTKWVIAGAGLSTIVAILVAMVLPESGEGPALTSTGETPIAVETAASPQAEGDGLIAEGRTEEAYNRYLAAVEADPKDQSARRGLTLIALLRYDRANAEFHGTEAIRLASAGSGGGVVAETEAVMIALDMLRGTGDPIVVAESARAALRGRPDDLIARWALVQALFAAGDACAAIPEIDAAIALAPGSYEFEEMRLIAFREAGDRAGGLEQLTRMHRKFPGNAQLSGWLFETYDTVGDTQAATMVLRDAAVAASDAAEEYLRLVDYVRRTQGEAAGDTELSRLAEDAEGTPLAGRLRTELALSLARQGRDAEAIALIKDLVENIAALSPQDANDAKTALAQLLQVKAGVGDAEEASSLLDEVLEADPSHVDALKARAASHIEAGQPRDALIDLRVAQGHSPRDPEVLTLMAAAYQLDGSNALAGDSLARAVEMADGGAAETELYARFLREQGRNEVADVLFKGLEEPALEDPFQPVPPAPAEGSPPSVRCSMPTDLPANLTAEP